MSRQDQHTASPTRGRQDEIPDAVRGVLDTYEQMPVMVAGLAGAEHRFDSLNAAYRAFVGANPLGLTAAELNPELASQQILDLCDQVYSSGEPASIREWRFQFSVGETGELHEFYLDLTVTPRRDGDGTINGLTVWALDATEQVRERLAAQQQTSEAEQRYQQARDVVAELQQTLLPPALPVLPRVEVAARYLVAAHDQTAGGDWFDAVPLPDGRLALLVGDIVGHGVTASAAMGQLRAVIDTVLSQTGDLIQALQWAADMAARSPAMHAATVCAAVLDPATGDLSYLTCGHPPPLVLAANGTSRYLAPSGTGPLGTGALGDLAIETLRPGEILVLYTDGLIERPGQTLSDGMGALARVAGDAVDNRVMPIGAPTSIVERVCRQSVELLTRTGHEDDVTVLAARRRTTPVVELHLDRAATPDAVGWLTAAATGWLELAGATPHDREAIDLAVSELVANVVEHAYPDDHSGPVRIRADLGVNGVLTLRVEDDGTWIPPGEPADTSGRGLWLTEATVDHLAIDHDGHGTVVTVRQRLSRPGILSDEPARPASTAGEQAFAIISGPDDPATIRVSGRLDVTTAARLADEIDVASRGGVHPLTIDLTDVTVLASAAVRVLFTARDQHAIHGHPLVIRTRAGGLAAQVVDLVGLKPHPPGDPDSIATAWSLT